MFCEKLYQFPFIGFVFHYLLYIIGHTTLSKPVVGTNVIELLAYVALMHDTMHTLRHPL
jgi:hypothetical protein